MMYKYLTLFLLPPANLSSFFEADMHRWFLFLLVAGPLLLVGCMAGDALFSHHHLNGLTVDEHNQSFLAAAFSSCIIALICVYGALGFNVQNNLTSNNCHSATRYFCGWHSSAYLEFINFRDSLINPGPMWLGFNHL
jgi:hypothetical protein